MNTELFPFAPSDDESELRTTEAGSTRPIDEPEDGPDLEAVPDDAVDAEPLPAAGTWEGDLERLRARFPGTRDGTLFCVYKLEQDTEVTLREIRPEAGLRGVSLGGRSLHAAKVLLGLEAPVKMRRRTEALAETTAETTAEDRDGDQGDGAARAGSFARFTDERRAPRGAARRRADPVTDRIAELGTDLGGDLEAVLRDAIEHAVQDRTETMRAAIRHAIDALQAALDD